MAKSIGKAYIQILPSAKGISGELSSQLSGEAKPAGEAGGLSLMSAMKGVLSVAALQKVGEGIWQAVNLGGELEQNIGGTEAVFGKFADKIKTTAYDAYKNMGMSASDYMATANKMAALFQGSGLEQSKAVDLTSEAMQRAADVASVMGLDTSAAMESIAGAAKGNFTKRNLVNKNRVNLDHRGGAAAKIIVAPLTGKPKYRVYKAIPCRAA